MNLNHARYVMKILKCGSFSQAAEELFISQPALSQTVKNVENEIKTPLFYKKNGLLSLTLAGEKYISIAEKMWQLERELENDINEIKQEYTGNMRFGIPAIYATNILPRALPLFCHEYPRVEIEIVEKGSPALLRDVAEGRIDMALLSGTISLSGFECIRISSETLGIFAGENTNLYKQYPNGEFLNIYQAKDERFVYLRHGHGMRIFQDFLAMLFYILVLLFLISVKLLYHLNIQHNVL